VLRGKITSAEGMFKSLGNVAVKSLGDAAQGFMGGIFGQGFGVLLGGLFGGPGAVPLYTLWVHA
jgi:xanthine/uracil permease